jgi:hypothetical protein
MPDTILIVSCGDDNGGHSTLGMFRGDSEAAASAFAEEAAGRLLGDDFVEDEADRQWDAVLCSWVDRMG